jgi:hypothetical protein
VSVRRVFAALIRRYGRELFRPCVGLMRALCIG